MATNGYSTNSRTRASSQDAVYCSIQNTRFLGRCSLHILGPIDRTTNFLGRKKIGVDLYTNNNFVFKYDGKDYEQPLTLKINSID